MRQSLLPLRVDHWHIVSAALGSRKWRVVTFRIAAGFRELIIIPVWVPSCSTTRCCVHWAHGRAGHLASSSFPDPVTQAKEWCLQPVTTCMSVAFHSFMQAFMNTARKNVTSIGNLLTTVQCSQRSQIDGPWQLIGYVSG